MAVRRGVSGKRSRTCVGPFVRGVRRSGAPREDVSEDVWDVGLGYSVESGVLGSGAYGVVKAATSRAGEDVAVKRVTCNFENVEEVKRLYREVHILRQVKNCEYVVKLKDVMVLGDNDLCLVFERMDYDLGQVIHGTRSFLLPDQIQFILFQLLSGLSFLRSARVIHRDLKPSNILVNADDLALRICDFGLARVAPPPSKTAYRSTHGGSSGALPPEDERLQEDTGSDSMAFPLPSAVHALDTRLATSSSTEESPYSEGWRQGQVSPEVTHRLHRGVAESPGPSRRLMTEHITTRWYRAPEVILRHDYDGTVDMWAMGCIMAELLQVHKAAAVPSFARHACFPGASSDLSRGTSSAYACTQGAPDQLTIIFRLLGTPTNDVLEMYRESGSHPSASRMLDRSLAEATLPAASAATEPLLATLSKRFPPSCAELQLVRRMLEYHPARRMTPEEALAHPYLATWKDKPWLQAKSSAVGLPLESDAAACRDLASVKKALLQELTFYATRGSLNWPSERATALAAQRAAPHALCGRYSPHKKCD